MAREEIRRPALAQACPEREAEVCEPRLRVISGAELGVTAAMPPMMSIGTAAPSSAPTIGLIAPAVHNSSREASQFKRKSSRVIRSKTLSIAPMDPATAHAVIRAGTPLADAELAHKNVATIARTATSGRSRRHNDVAPDRSERIARAAT